MSRRPLIRARGLAAARESRPGATIVVTLDRWPQAKRPALPAVPLPADADPSEFDWSPLAGGDVIIVAPRGADRHRVARAVAEIQAAGPRRLIVATPDGRHRFCCSAANGIEWAGEGARQS